MKIYYYLFGAKITQTYFEEDFSVVLDMIKDDFLEYEVLKYTPEKQHPSDLLNAVGRGGAYAEITVTEYYKIKTLNKDQNA